MVAVASSGRPTVGGEGDREPSPAFFDYAFTFGLVATLALVAVVLYQVRPSERFRRERKDNRGLFASLVALVLASSAALLILLFGRDIVGDRQKEAAQPPGRPAQPTTAQQPEPTAPYEPEFKWLPVVLLGGAAVATAAGMAAYSRRRRGAAESPGATAELVEELSSLVDEAVDDLRAEPDPRRAVVAAYARMERALSAYGLPRRPFEAPLEFLERVAPALRAHVPATQGLVFELTHLYERAKFSDQRVDTEMKDEAIETLISLRAELRREAEAA